MEELARAENRSEWMGLFCFIHCEIVDGGTGVFTAGLFLNLVSGVCMHACLHVWDVCVHVRVSVCECFDYSYIFLIKFIFGIFSPIDIYQNQYWCRS